MPSTRAAECSAGAELGSALVHDSRGATQASSAGPLRARRPSRRHQRALVFVDDECRQRARHPRDEGLSYVRLDNGSRFLLKDAVDTAGDLLLGSAVMEREKGWNLLCKFFDNMGPIPHHMHQTRCAGQARRPQGQARGVLLPAAVQQDRQQLSVHVHGPRARHDQGRRAALPRELEQGRQRHPVSLARVPARAGHRLADPSGHPARAGFARAPTSRRWPAMCSRCFSPRSKAASRHGR